ncbi:B3 domain-containing protein Os11g0197600-like [Typha angustifolia]|uniref:B3 domain-containing protein Os11g0197600-like n=1 Tax=Typha angustifolia TaxID=59011 RepID=UPI003C307B80
MARSSPRFFKVFLPHLSSEHLKIPPAFQEHLRSKPSGGVYLKGPSGNMWHVLLVENSKGLFFESGWKEFVSDHSLEAGDFLVLQYDGHSHFSVLVFDATACEKDAAFVAVPRQGDIARPVHKTEKEEEGETVIEGSSKALVLPSSESVGVKSKRRREMDDCIAVDVPPLKKKCSPSERAETKGADLGLYNAKSRTSLGKREIDYNVTSRETVGQPGSRNLCKNPMSSGTIVKKAKSNAQSGCATTHSQGSAPCSVSKKLVTFSKTAASEISRKYAGSLKLIKYSHVRWRGEAVATIQKMPALISQRRPVTQEEINKSLERAKLFKSRNPFTLIVMQDSYCYNSFFMNIPVHFAREYLPKIGRKMTLWDPQGTSWAVSYVSYGYRGALSGGWGAFSFANNLEKHDVCVFELIKKNQMKVHIFRVVKEIKPLIRSSTLKYLTG